MIYLFNNQDEIIEVVNQTAIKSFIHEQTLTKERYVSDIVTVELKGLSNDLITEMENFAIPSVDDPMKFQYFYILKETTEHNVTTLIGVHKGIDELRNEVVRDVRPQDKSARYVAEQLLSDSLWTVGYCADAGERTSNYYYLNKFDALKKLCEIYKLEMQLFIEIDGSKGKGRIGNRYIDFKKRIGIVTGERVTYGHRAVSVVKESDRADVVTALLGRGRGEERSSKHLRIYYDSNYTGPAIKLATIQASGNVSVDYYRQGEKRGPGEVRSYLRDDLNDVVGVTVSNREIRIYRSQALGEDSSYTRKQTFKYVEWRKSDGDPADKPWGQDYLEFPEMTARYGMPRSNGNRAKLGIVEFDTDDPERLLRLTYQALVENCRPKVHLKATTVALDEVHIGDTVRVIRPDKQMDYGVRVFKIVWNRTGNKPRIVSTELGDNLTVSSAERERNLATKIISEIDGQFGDTVAKLVAKTSSADGKNSNWYTDYDPHNDPATHHLVRINDHWFAPDPEFEGEIILYRWNGEAWEEVIKTKNWAVVDEKIREAEERVKAFKEEFDRKQARNENELNAFQDSLKSVRDDIQAAAGKTQTLIDTTQGLKLELQNTETSQLWAQIRATATGMLREYHQDTIRAEIAETAAAFERKMTDANNSISQLISRADGIQSSVKNLKDGTESQITQLAGLIGSKVAREEVQSIIRSSGDTIYLAVKDKIPRSMMTGKEIKTAIQMDRSGITISGSHLSITADTYIQNGVIKNAHIGDLSANKITGGQIDAAKIKVINLDVLSLISNKAKFIEALFDGRNSSLKINSDGITLNQKDGSVTNTLDRNGLAIYREGIHVGSFRWLNSVVTSGPYRGLRAIAMSAQPGHFLALSRWNSEAKQHYWSLTLGDDGRIRLYDALMASNSNHGLRLREDRLSGKSGLALINVFNDAGILMLEDGDIYLHANDGYVHSWSGMVRRVAALESKLSDAEKYWGRSFDSGKTAPIRESTGQIRVGDTVRIKDGVTYYYDENDWAVTIPTWKNGRNYRTETYVVKQIKPDSQTWRTRGYYRITIDGWDIAWAAKDDVYKV